MKDDGFEKVRREYQSGNLRRADLAPEPIEQLKTWLDTAIKADCPDPTAMVLATVDANNHPDTRIVLLKNIADTKLCFFSSFTSQKGKQLSANPYVALNFYWSKFERQVRIKGKVSFMPDEQAQEYFSSRPKTSQVAALVSAQSEVIEGRDFLEKNYAKFLADYEGREVPKPENWGGYYVEPCLYEFWQGCENRLHDRFVYEEKGGEWNVYRLAP
jgi:pyridoxamine 5'-phosphate oxidase